MKKLILAVLAGTVAFATPAAARDRWTPEQAKSWYGPQRWLVGANYLPANAINQFEMWQPETFDPARIDLELGWAQKMGMNTMRVFLHDQLWEKDPKGFAKRIDTFLTIAHKHGIKPLFVLFDSCWDPDPKMGPQHPPIPGVHNSGWVQAPGTTALQDPKQYPRLEAYVKGVVGAFAKDDRILGWDVWNEPDNGADQYPGQPANKTQLVTQLLPSVFQWARSANPTQPLTSGVWLGTDWAPNEKHRPIEDVQLNESDVITFHDYSWPETMELRMTKLEAYGRPIICTEYMARGAGSTFDGSLPLGKKHKIGMINWGFVDGKEQTRMPWDSWQRPYVGGVTPTLWFHDVLHTDGTPYRQAEVDLITKLTSN